MASGRRWEMTPVIQQMELEGLTTQSGRWVAADAEEIEELRPKRVK